ncbi:MAG: [FeFe] hydrogenase H-cluster radical SAM maturase HydE [Lachnospiraceae bacterium]|nr:[FeFe] hydrogenase H-cluster radical SAM maturase HydE [Lachnospiraceae bacterium]
MNNKEIINLLHKSGELSKELWIKLLESYTDVDRTYAAKLARKVADDVYGKNVYIRGLIEFSNYCKNDCYYCGIRANNKCVDRYRLTQDEILECCNNGYKLGFRTFVLQGGEDLTYSDEWYETVIKSIKEKYSDCAVTLSIGERSRESYEKWFKAGADRFLLRHETITNEHYRSLHPENLKLDNRIRCLKDLKDIGYQVGCGIMVGSPYQNMEHIANDMIFMKEFQPNMVGVGPFIPHKDTPFKDMPAGSYELTLFLLSLIRLMLPKVLLPATTALGTIKDGGREEGILSGANVVMPNLSPKLVRDKYMLYNNKLNTGTESAAHLDMLREKMKMIGYNVVVSRGDYKFEQK